MGTPGNPPLIGRGFPDLAGNRVVVEDDSNTRNGYGSGMRVILFAPYPICIYIYIYYVLNAL